MSTGAVTKRFRLGANYWSRAGGPRMWERFDEAIVKDELRALRACGLDCLRMFAFAPTMMPQPPAADDASLVLMAHFADLAHEAGLSIFPTPLVGHMSGALAQTNVVECGAVVVQRDLFVRTTIGVLEKCPRHASAR